MPSAELEQFISAVLFQAFGEDIQIKSYQKVSGGCINNGLKINSSIGNYFLKWNEKKIKDLFLIEEKGLKLISELIEKPLSVPKVIGSGHLRGKDYLLLEYIQKSQLNHSFWKEFGHGIAKLHLHSSNYFGLPYDNYIGSLPQNNSKHLNWVDFYIENRLEVQLGLAIYNGYVDQSFAKRFRYLYSQLPGLLSDEPPSLLHGDLWSGNFMVNQEGSPCLIDPAIYYGNREIEIAFTQLFGGFNTEFYSSYQEQYPFVPGWEERIPIYHLYPLLVHLNLFGESYLLDINRILRRYC